MKQTTKELIAAFTGAAIGVAIDHRDPMKIALGVTLGSALGFRVLYALQSYMQQRRPE